MIEEKLLFRSKSSGLQSMDSENDVTYLENHHFKGVKITSEITNLIQITQKLAEIKNLSEKDCGIIFKTYLGIRQKIKENGTGLIYFPAKFRITLLYVFRVDQHLRKRYLIEYKELMRIQKKLGLNKNSRISNLSLQLIDFDFSQYRYTLDEYADLYWNTLVSSEFLLSHLNKLGVYNLGINADQFMKILHIIYQETKRKYSPDPSLANSKSKLSYILNLFILCYQLIDRCLNLEKSTNESDELIRSATIESDLRLNISRVIFENKMLVGTVLLIDRRFRYDIKFDKLKSELNQNKDLASKIRAIINL
ncbi:MAG: hypothetical protein HeimC2_31930 [Candidatus Heimdallarchaeota archaeon LC_2]|nr:MAG: hypothetical protein HeimC2_31930 [Candidatus Heimdallarchaeota archaeon LC_2]